MSASLLVRRTALVLVALIAVVAGLGLAGCRDEAATAGEIWYCPMHPTYTADRPGTCPICNMDLVRKEGVPAPAGAAADAGAGRRILHWRHPMDPAITSPVPAKDSMGMDYLPVYADEAARLDGGTAVPDRGTVDLEPEGVRLAGVRTEPARLEAIRRTVRTVGTVVVDERRLHRVQTKISGWIETLHVGFEGQPVRRGQPMLALYSPELVASQEEFLLARRNAERFVGSTIPEVRQGGEDLVAAARRRLELFDVPPRFIERLAATGRVSRTVELLAPASGHVIAKQAVAGARVEPGTELFTLADLTRVWVEADFYEADAPNLEVGQTATLRLPYDPASERIARIGYVYPQLNLESRTLRARFELDNPGLRLKPGMFVDVEQVQELPAGIVVPDSAVIDSGRRQIVFVAPAPGHFEPRVVRVVARSGGLAQLAPGPVAVGEQVAVKANFLLDSESRLRAALAGLAEGQGEAPPAAGGHAGHGAAGETP